MSTPPPQPPAIPPRPDRAKSPLPAIPPRPSRKPAGEAAAPAQPAPGTPREPTPNLIPESTKLHAPVARPARPPAIPKTSSDYHRDDSRTEGIPQIGRRVPMDPNTGDVQAPTPNATPSGGRKKHVYREEWEMDEGAYGAQRGKTPYSLSSSDLNAVVARSGSPGVGASARDNGVPDEEMGYIATEEYAKSISRAASPNGGERKNASPVKSRLAQQVTEEGTETPRDEDGNVIHVDEPVRAGVYRHGTADVDSRAESVNNGEEGESEQQEDYPILALDEVLKRQGQQTMHAAVTPRSARSRPASVLAFKEDKGKKEGEEAVPSPKLDTRGPSRARTPFEELSPVDPKSKPLFEDNDEEDEEEEKKPLPKDIEKLRPRLHDHRFPSNDTWEDAPEHSQLETTVESPAPGEEKKDEDDEDDAEEEEQPPKPQPRTSAGPEPQYVHGQPDDHYQPGEELEQARKERESQRDANDYSIDLQHLPEDQRLERLLNQGTDTPSSETSSRSRKGGRKFPSNDTWEDVPPSQDLQEPIDTEPIQRDRATTTATSAVNEAAPRPTTGAAIDVSPATSRKPEVPAVPARPPVPARPKRETKPPSPPLGSKPELTKSEEEKPRDLSPVKAALAAAAAATSPVKPTPPSIPDRPKPPVPKRPAKPAVLARFPSQEEKEPAPAPKPKPPVPARVGGKIAALKAGLGNLEDRLKLGPFMPKKEEKKEEEPVETEKAVEVKEPLVDVRKGRARGPRGRKAPTREEPKKEEKKEVGVVKMEIAGAWTVWTVDDEFNNVIVHTAATEEKKPEEVKEEAQKEEPKPESKEEVKAEPKEPTEEAQEPPKQEPAPAKTDLEAEPEIIEHHDEPAELVDLPTSDSKPEPPHQEPEIIDHPSTDESKPAAAEPEQAPENTDTSLDASAPAAAVEHVKNSDRHEITAEIERARDAAEHPPSPPAHTDGPEPSTVTLPGVTGTADQIAVATQQEAKEPEVQEAPAHENPTAIPAAQHPEDAKAPAHVPLVETKPEVQEAEEKDEDDDFEKVEKVGAVPEGEQRGAERAVEDVRTAADGVPVEERKAREE